ncbi:Glycosyltransferase involved in cell wall bisynthesis [Daejeonella rubra]|uniref:Glycosyltransferase involved in cell wall bisynthesis n=1 Tax=Daejeonella rubra TaxID=990371 RepID=A0A1G9VVI4_9SPHI|nr:glycosyltransferase [Daejeonella rubra]SDM75877.1 Glycosyltransferase involved in cell wall bisynthesis [Daejeonella rubra]
MILKGKHIFILGATKFDGPDQSTSYNTAKELAKNNFVYYIDYPITWKDYFKLKGTEQIRTRKKYFSPFSDGLTSGGIENLKIIISPPLISINFLPEGKIYRLILKFNELLIRKRIRKVIKLNNISEFIFINSFNFHYPGIADSLKPALTVYHCVDPMIIPYDMKHGIISEDELVAKSDLVICTSRMLYEEKLKQNRNTHFIPNAADIAHSSKALDKDLPVNIHLSDLKKPVIGYAGSIERRIDYALLKEVAEANKDKSFVFAGPLMPEFVPEWFLRTENIFYIGRIPFEEIPGLIKGFDVAIIPFKKDAVSRTIFPLKLFEYLGAGKPVVASNFNPDLKDFTHEVVSYCDNAQSFSLAIDAALKTEDPNLIQPRLNVARENTWERRVEEIAELIFRNLKKTGN